MCKLNSSHLSRKEEERKKPRQKDGIEIGLHITFNTCERTVLGLTNVGLLNMRELVYTGGSKQTQTRHTSVV